MKLLITVYVSVDLEYIFQKKMQSVNMHILINTKSNFS